MRNNYLKTLAATAASIVIFAVVFLSIIPNSYKYLSFAVGNFVLKDNNLLYQKFTSSNSDNRSNWQYIRDKQDSNQQSSEHEFIASNVIRTELKKPLVEVVVKATILSSLTYQARKLYILRSWIFNSVQKLIFLVQQVFQSSTTNEKPRSEVTVKVVANEDEILNDHIEINVNTLPYDRRNILMTIYAALRSNETLCKIADESNLQITPHLVYRYLAAAEWSKYYDGKRYIANSIAHYLRFVHCTF